MALVRRADDSPARARRTGSHDPASAARSAFPREHGLPQPPAEPTSGPSGCRRQPSVPPWGIVLLVAATFGGGHGDGRAHGVFARRPARPARARARRPPRVHPGDRVGGDAGRRAPHRHPERPDAVALGARGGRSPSSGSLSARRGPRRWLSPPTSLCSASGWVLSTVGWNTAGGSIGNWQADRLPAHQRGKVSGLTGLAMQISPVVGIILVGPVRVADILLVFAIPAAVGLAPGRPLRVFAREPDSRGCEHADPPYARARRAQLRVRPRAVPDFAWNWVGRFVFFLGLTLTTSFSVFFFAQRLACPSPMSPGAGADLQPEHRHGHCSG